MPELKLNALASDVPFCYFRPYGVTGIKKLYTAYNRINFQQLAV